MVTIDAVVTHVAEIDGSVILRDEHGRDHFICDGETWRALVGRALLGPLVGWIVSLQLDALGAIVAITRIR